MKFLRVLETGEYLRVGSSTPRRVNVRIIAATNKDLESAARHQQFRQDLFFRLRSVNIYIPPLRKRPEDIPVLVERFATDFCAKNRIPFRGISPEAMTLLRSYPWPGNVRELRNVVESMLVLDGGKRLEAEDVRKHLRNDHVGTDERSLPVPLSMSVEQAERELMLRALLDIKGNIIELKNLLHQQIHTLESSHQDQTAGASRRTPSEEPDLSLNEMERKMIVEALERHKGNRRVAARVLNISERTLYRKIKEYGLE